MRQLLLSRNLTRFLALLLAFCSLGSRLAFAGLFPPGGLPVSGTVTAGIDGYQLEVAGSEAGDSLYVYFNVSQPVAGTSCSPGAYWCDTLFSVGGLHSPGTFHGQLDGINADVIELSFDVNFPDPGFPTQESAEPIGAFASGAIIGEQCRYKNGACIEVRPVWYALIESSAASGTASGHQSFVSPNLDEVDGFNLKFTGYASPAVPEPSTFALLGSVALGLMIFLRRRIRRFPLA